MREEAVHFGKRRSLVGIITDPPKTERANNRPAIVILNSGIIHRVGLYRLHVKMARDLAAMGFVVLRFDFSGIGDSEVRHDNLPFGKSAISETQEAMNYLSATRGVERFVLAGICSGAVISFRTACYDPRVVGVVLINAGGYLHGTNNELNTYIGNLTLARHYWRIALFSSFSVKNWWKSITGKVDYSGLIRAMVFQLRNLFRGKRNVFPRLNNGVKDLRLLTERGVRLLLIHSEGDVGLDYLHVVLGDGLRELISCEKLQLEIIQGANHIFTLLWSRCSSASIACSKVRVSMCRRSW